MYDVNYYKVIPNKEFINLSFTPKHIIEKIIRIIPIKDNDKFKSNKLELGIITINLSNIRVQMEHSYIKIFLKQVKYQLNSFLI